MSRQSLMKITSEIERYMANPGPALSYKIGQLKIRQLRQQAQENLGEQFDIRISPRCFRVWGVCPCC